MGDRGTAPQPNTKDTAMIPAIEFYKDPKKREIALRHKLGSTRVGYPGTCGAPCDDGCRWGSMGDLSITDANEARPRTRRLEHGGWFMDSFQEDKVIGVVVKIRIPRRRSRSEGIVRGEDHVSRVRYSAGMRSTMDGFCMTRRGLHEDEIDAAYEADSAAERYAEDCRDAEETEVEA